MILYIGVDPSTHDSAIAWRGECQGIKVKGSMTVKDLLDLNEAVTPVLEWLKDGFEFTEIIAAVEYPMWNAPDNASPIIRAAANTYIRLLKRVFGAKIKVQRVNPNTWQFTMFGSQKKRIFRDTKQNSLYLAEQVYGYKPANHNEADAACLCEYAASMIGTFVRNKTWKNQQNYKQARSSKKPNVKGNP